MNDNIIKGTVRLHLVGYIKDLLKEYNASFFDLLPHEVELAQKKHERGKELTVDELVLLAKHIVQKDTKVDFRDIILSNYSIIFPDDGREIFADVHDAFSEFGIYFLYESYYVMKFLDEAPEIILRALTLRKLFIASHPSRRVREFCKEVYLTYINGNFIASAVLLRSIVETLYLEKFEIKRCNFWELKEAAKETGVVSNDIYEKVNKIREEVNNILYNITNRSINEEKNRELINITQAILEYLLDDRFRISKKDRDRVNKTIMELRKRRKLVRL